MGSFCGSGNNTVTKTDTQTYTPNAGGLAALQNANYWLGQVNPNQAPLLNVNAPNAGQTGAYDYFNSLAANNPFSPYAARASDLFNQSATTPDIQKFMNPYADAAMQALQKYNFDPQTRAAMGASRGAAGGVGAARSALTAANLAKTQSDATTGALANYYATAGAQAAQERASQAGAAYGLGSLGSQAVGSALGIGGAQMQGANNLYGYQQAPNAALYNQQMMAFQTPFSLASAYAGFAPAFGGTQTGTGTTTYPQQSPWGQLLGLGLSGLGIAGKLGWQPFAPGGGQKRGGRIKGAALGGTMLSGPTSPMISPDVIGGAAYLPGMGALRPPGMGMGMPGGGGPMMQQGTPMAPPGGGGLVGWPMPTLGGLDNPYSGTAVRAGGSPFINPFMRARGGVAHFGGDDPGGSVFDDDPEALSQWGRDLLRDAIETKGMPSFVQPEEPPQESQPGNMNLTGPGKSILGMTKEGDPDEAFTPFQGKGVPINQSVLPPVIRNDVPQNVLAYANDDAASTRDTQDDTVNPYQRRVPDSVGYEAARALSDSDRSSLSYPQSGMSPYAGAYGGLPPLHKIGGDASSRWASSPWMALMAMGARMMQGSGRDARGLPIGGSPLGQLLSTLGHGAESGIKTLEDQRQQARTDELAKFHAGMQQAPYGQLTAAQKLEALKPFKIGTDPNTFMDVYGIRDPNTGEIHRVDPKTGMISSDQSTAPTKTLTGEEYLATLNPETAATVRAIAEGRIAPPSINSRSPQARAMVNHLYAYDPNGDTTIWKSRNETRAAFSKGTEGRAVTSLGTLMGHMSDLADTSDKLAQKNLKPWNKVENAIRDNLGGTALADYNITRTAVADELSRVFQGTGVAAENEKQRWLDALDDSRTPAQFRRVVGRLVSLTESRMQNLAAQYDRGMHYTPDNPQSAAVNGFLSGPSKEKYQRLKQWSTTEPETKKKTAPATTDQAAPPNQSVPTVKSKEEYDNLPSGTEFIDANGKRYRKP